MIEVAGQPFLHWVIVWAQRQGLQDFVFSTGHLADKIESWLPTAKPLQSGHWQTYREKELLGTGGGVRACAPLCHDNILATNGDSLVIADIRPALHQFLTDTSLDGVIVGKHVPDTSRYGSLAVDETGRLTGFREKVPGAGLINTGIYLFRKKLLEAFPTDKPLSMEYDIIPQMLTDGARIMAHPTPEEAPFLDIGTPETVVQAEHFIRANFTV